VSKVVTVAHHGPVLVSADLHGHYQDFARLRDIFLAGGDDCVWIGVGDWVHGPSDARRDLYDYPDSSGEILRELFALMDTYPGRVLSLLGNHEHAHIGGVRTSKFHDDEAAFLESQLDPAFTAEIKRRFRSWPLMALFPSLGVVVTHGALAGDPAGIERIRYEGDNDARAHEILRAAMTHYGYTEGDDVKLLAALGPPYSVIVHGHDRDENGHSPSGERALLLCTSFGARQERKAYLWLERRYDGVRDLESAIRYLWA
jgi:hypothetical protein